MKRFRLTSTLFLIFVAFVLLLGTAPASQATHGDEHASITYWNLAPSPFNGHDPHEQLADVTGQTNQLADSTPTMVTAMENACGFMCAIMFWNPLTNDFESVCVTGGLDFAVDINRSSTLGTGGPPVMGTFGGGDAWSAVFGNTLFSPYVVFRGNDTVSRHYNTGTSQATGIRVNPANGKIYMGDFGNSGPVGFTPGRIVELDPATNAVRKWTIGSRPYFLAISGGMVYATAVQGSMRPDEIVRLDPTSGALTRWPVPGASNFESVVAEGNPNYISVDTTNSSRLWFSETESDQIARIDTSANTITEWTKPGIEHPMAVNNSGVQAFFTEAGFGADPGHVSVLNVSESDIGVTTAAPPTTVTLVPAESTATFNDAAPIVVRATITPSVFDSPGVDPSGITRFPIPPGTLRPTGMTGVWAPQTISGSMEGTHHVFTLESEAIVVCELTLSPDSASNMVGTPHTVTATVTCNGEPQTGVVVTFTVAGSGGSNPTPPAGTCTTNPMGQCTFTYTSPTAGSDVITAEATAQGQMLSDTATKTWTGVLPPQCPPEDDDDDDGHEDDDDNDGLTNKNENSLLTLLGIADSDFDGVVDGNDDSNMNGEDDEDEDDDDDCPDEDEDDDGEDDEDEDDDDNGDDDDD